MQNAAASNQFRQPIARPSFAAGSTVQVWNAESQDRRVFQSSLVDGTLMFQLVSQPGSYPVFSAVASPIPLFKCVCFPAPEGGRQPASHAATNARNRPTVASYLSSRKLLTDAGWV